ncbi:MAG: hypothetical protein HY829_07760 [Actinobacteria bacterium]|nr:hypothetical protein [Actinomycetota bacterium]
MTHPPYGPSSPGNPAPPQPVFERFPAYDTLSPSSPYTVVFEPWPARPRVPDDEDGVRVPAEPASAASPVDLRAPAVAVALAEGEGSQAGPTDDGQSAEDHEPAVVPRPYVAAPQQYIPAGPPAGPGQPSLAPTFLTPAPTLPSSPYGGPPEPSHGGPDPYLALLQRHKAPPGFGSARPRTENVGRGLAMASLAVVGGCVLSAFVYHLGFVASIVALAMGAAGIFLYAKGAGAPPRKGGPALVVLLIAGILLAWVCSVATELYFFYVHRTGTTGGALVFVLSSVLSFDLFKAMLKDFLIFVGFGVLGIFSVARRLLSGRVR